MKKILTAMLLLITFALVGLAQTKPETKIAPASAPKLLTPEQLTRLQQANSEREKAQLRETVARLEREKLEAFLLTMIREFALELHLDLDQYEIDLSLIAQGVMGFKPKPPPVQENSEKK